MKTGGFRWAGVALAVAIATGCAETKPAKSQAAARPDSEIRITRVDRLGWNAPAEPDLFRVEFGPGMSREIRRRAGIMDSEGVMEAYYAEFAVMAEEVGRELVARGLCLHGARFASVAQGAGEGANLTAFYRCSPRPLL